MRSFQEVAGQTINSAPEPEPSSRFSEVQRQKLRIIDAGFSSKWKTAWTGVRDEAGVLLPSKPGKFDPESDADKAAWLLVLDDYSVERIQRAVRFIIRREGLRFPIDMGDFKNYVIETDRIHRREQQDQERLERLPRPDPSERDKAWRACASALSKRICGLETPIVYAGPFDAQGVADSIDIDRERLPDMGYNEQLFKDLLRQFDAAWNEG